MLVNPKLLSETELLETFEWERIARTILESRMLDEIEETKLVPEKKVLYQFTARGHDVTQVILASLLKSPRDAVSAYYRSRPTLLTIGLSLVDAFSAPMGKSGGFSDGRDIGVVCNFPNQNGPTCLPMSGDVGSQYTPLVGWAAALKYRKNILRDPLVDNAIGVVLGGEGSVATNGFWSALTIATTLKLPVLFYIEDNGYAISVTSEKQTPGCNIAKNLESFENLTIFDGNGSDIIEASSLIFEAVNRVRSWQGPVLLRLKVPRLSGHSGQDTQAYKSPEFIEAENQKDPLHALKSFLVPALFDEKHWETLKKETDREVNSALETALNLSEPDPETVLRHVYCEVSTNGTFELQQKGGMLPEGVSLPPSSETPSPEGPRINITTAVRRTLQHELTNNPRVLVFGEDIGAKGGVHAVTLGLQDEFGEDRVFDTSLSEEGIIGRAVGMAICGLMPVVEIQFRKYADPATEQLNNCGTIRWRTANRFAAPIVVRLAGGFAKCGDPWHSVSSESIFAHSIGWQVAYPSNAEDAVGLLREAMRSNNPTIFFEHRHLYDATWSRRPYPGNDYVIPFGKAKLLKSGEDLTIVSWGAMVERCESAIEVAGANADLIDLRSVAPWDKQCIKESVEKTRRLIIVHEDGMTCGLGAEIAAWISENCFYSLDAPIKRIAVPDIPIPHNIALMDEILPSTESIAASILEMMEE